MVCAGDLSAHLPNASDNARFGPRNSGNGLRISDSPTSSGKTLPRLPTVPECSITTMLSPALLLALLILLPTLYLLLTPRNSSTIPVASGRLPVIGHSISYAADPIAFLKRQRVQHGNVFLVDLAIIKPIFILGPEANNAFFSGTEKQGVSSYAVLDFVFGQDSGPSGMPPHRRSSG
jgi:hypothetical protein